ncbi:uncharacterized protein EV422DRAFT_565482 [Fimicolochytrium jonesii]|uniref:uncharacterized protein n=1 Tax=Fimicolochytrium jonesii TaxID=1396493 RepID=UPI0022FE9753|nr:uncharacterized protein EV422DRAFT_565482 [Fimicolochytrium jonesii]KAI8823541.1 hypothetical protein EV422DRAFT_565482 [Fimicolochytrium jonesii]
MKAEKVLPNKVIDGTVTHIAFNRLRNPSPLLGVFTRRVEGENISYHVDVTPIDVSRSEDVLSFSGKTWTLPGNLPIVRAAVGASGRVIASRRYDTSLFRMYTLLECDSDHSCAVANGLVGPPTSEALSDHLLAVELYSPDAASPSVFFVSKDEHDEHIHVSMAMFTLVDGEWVKDELWPRPPLYYHRDSYSPMLGHDVPENDGAHQLHWLTSPIVAASANSTTLAWTFLSRILTLDYVGEASGKIHGYVLEESKPLDGFSPADLRVKGANLNPNGTVFSFVNDNNDIITFSRTAVRLKPKEDRSWVESFFLYPNEIGFFYDAAAEAQGHANAPAKTKPKSSSPWKVQTNYLNSLDGATNGKAVVAFHQLEGSRLATNFMHPDETYILVLYTNNVLQILEVTQRDKGSHIQAYIRNRWPMFVAMLAVVVVFAANEMTGEFTPYTSLLTAGLSFWVLLSLLLNEPSYD